MKALCFNIMLIACLLLIISCSKDEKKISGVYIKYPSFSTADTLFLYFTESKFDSLGNSNNAKKFKYRQVLRVKATGKKIIDNENYWYINQNGRVEIENLFLRNDIDTIMSPYSQESFKHALIDVSLPISGKKLILNYDEDSYYFKVSNLKK